MSGELKPCPVCGEQPRWRGTRSDYARGIYRLQCLGETHLFQSYGPDEAGAIAAWNTRAPAPSDQEKLVGWQDIATAPRDGRGVIVIDIAAEKPEPGMGYWAGNVWSCVDPAPGEGIDLATIQAITWVSPTHWMPLPAAPDTRARQAAETVGRGSDV